MADPTLTEDGLRTILAERATGAEHRSGRLVEVHARVARSRRRRAAASSGAALVVVVVAVVAGVLATRPTRAAPDGPSHPRPTTSSSVHGAALPAYLRGGRLVASRDATDPKGITLTFVPTTLAFGVVEGCSWPGQVGDLSNAPMATVRINGKEYMGIGCGGDSPLGTDGDSDMGRPPADFAKDYGISVGKPVQVTFGWPAGTSRPGSRFRIGVYAGVPLDAYPFPARPSTLPAVSFDGLQDYQRTGNLLIASGTAAVPDGDTVSPPRSLPHGIEIDAVAVEPGEITVLVDGRAVFSARSWDYTVQEFSASFTRADLGLAPGHAAVITVRTTRFTAATWKVAVRPAVVRPAG